MERKKNIRVGRAANVKGRRRKGYFRIAIQS